MVGDIVQIKPGMSIPCDAILVRGTGVTTDESAMTGESIELKKETMEMCEVRLEEKLEEEKFHKNEDKDQIMIYLLLSFYQEHRFRREKDGLW